jgi:hypothetical protein
MNVISPARLLLALIAAVVLSATPKLAHAYTLEDVCRKIHPSWHQYFSRKQCVRHRRKAEKTRKCISRDLERMESRATAIKNGIQPKMSLADAKKVMQTVLGRELSVVRARDDAKDRVVNTEITTNCASAFQFVIQLRAAPSGELRYVKMWSKFTPKGYPNGYLPALSRDFEADTRKNISDWNRVVAKIANERARKRRKAEAAKRRVREAARQRREAEAAKIRRAEDARKRREMLALKKRQALAPPPLETDHCAPDLAKRERIRRLGRFGVVRRIGDNSFRAGAHVVGFPPKGAGPTFCR